MKYFLPIIVICSVLLASCTTQRNAEPKRYHTLQEKATTTLQLDNRLYTMNASVQVWPGELIILSLQPMLGIEMMRAEATKDSVLLIDKMNRRYTVIHYNTFSKIVSPTPSFKMIQDYVTAPQNNKKKNKNELSFQIGTHTINIKCAFTQREYNTLKTPKRQDLKKYKQTTLREILPI